MERYLNSVCITLGGQQAVQVTGPQMRWLVIRVGPLSLSEGIRIHRS